MVARHSADPTHDVVRNSALPVIVLIYSIMRFLIENFRGDAVRGRWFGGSISTSQLVAIGTGSVALLLPARFHRLRVPPPPGVV